ncbi:MAG: hypothetical protein ACHQCH_00620 [Solirubrobacterales bacterium]
MRLRNWLAVGLGQGPSAELLAAEADLDRRTVREVQRLVRRGGEAPDVVRARFAVAYARDLQRRKAHPLLVAFWLLLLAGFVWQFVSQIDAGHVALTIFWGASTAWGVYATIAIWRMRSRAPRAELQNMRVLREAGHPYPDDADSRPVKAPWQAVAVAAIFATLFYDVGFGGLTVATNGEALSPSRVLEKGAAFAVLMTLANLTLMRSKNNKDAARQTAGQRS